MTNSTGYRPALWHGENHRNWVATMPPAAADNNHMAAGPAADLLALLDELAARGRALRLAEAEGAAARPEPAAEATGGHDE